MLLMEDVTISRGDRDLMSEVDWRLMPKDRIGLVGPNGAGKSTLLSASCGRIPVMGKVLVKPGITLGYLVQTAVSGSRKTCWEEASSQMHRLNAAQAALDAAAAACAAGDTSEAALNLLAETQDAFGAAGGYNVDEKVASVLSGLGFTPADYKKSCTDFSGGWQMKIALARLLLSEPDMLLLDEPTNHLDAAAKAWLGRYIAAYEGTVVIVTHEEALLRSAALTGVIEVRDQRAHVFRGDYAKFLVEREERVLRALKEYEEQQREIDKLQSYITRFGATMSHAASAQSKRKMLERIEAGRVDLPTELDTQADRPSLRFPRPQFCEMRMITLAGAAWGWNGRPLYSGCSVEVERGMRLAILGPNGCGKSTLLAALSGRLPLLEGKRETAEHLEMGVFTQDLAQELPLDAVALDVVLKHAQAKDMTINAERCRNVMGALGLSGSKALQKIGTMSGGEKARVALSMFVLVPHNLLLLDEPSNHLDVGTVEVLTEALQEYQGTIIVVTHNRHFCELLAPTHVARVLGEPGRQTVAIEARPLRPSDWEGMGDDASAAGGGGAPRGTATLKLAGGKGRGTSTLAKAEAAPERERYPWEAEELVDTGMVINKQGKVVSKERKLTPEQKRQEKKQAKSSSSAATITGAPDWEDRGSEKESFVVYRKGDKKPKKKGNGR